MTTLRGVRQAADEAGDQSNFTAKVPGRALDRFLAQIPEPLGLEARPFARQSRGGLGRGRAALDRLRLRRARRAVRRQGPPVRPENTLVIASSVSNGGGGVVAGGERRAQGPDRRRRGVRAQRQPALRPALRIRQGSGPVLYRHSRPLYDYLSVVKLYQACANLANPTRHISDRGAGRRRARNGALPVAGRRRAADEARPCGVAAGSAATDQRLRAAAGAERRGPILLGLLCGPGRGRQLRQRLQPCVRDRRPVRLLVRRRFPGVAQPGPCRPRARRRCSPPATGSRRPAASA